MIPKSEWISDLKGPAVYKFDGTKLNLPDDFPDQNFCHSLAYWRSHSTFNFRNWNTNCNLNKNMVRVIPILDTNIKQISGSASGARFTRRENQKLENIILHDIYNHCWYISYHRNHTGWYRPSDAWKAGIIIPIDLVIDTKGNQSHPFISSNRKQLKFRSNLYWCFQNDAYHYRIHDGYETHNFERYLTQ